MQKQISKFSSLVKFSYFLPNILSTIVVSLCAKSISIIFLLTEAKEFDEMTEDKALDILNEFCFDNAEFKTLRNNILDMLVSSNVV